MSVAAGSSKPARQKGQDPMRSRTTMVAALVAFLTWMLVPGGTHADAPPPAWGGPEAQVTDGIPDGAPVSGATLTLAPELAPLPAGTTTWEVRLDILASEVEIAPDVRYVAWTFGGSVPGPVLHVRQGDRIVFTMANRSAELVEVT